MFPETSILFCKGTESDAGSKPNRIRLSSLKAKLVEKDF
jgi:hypothetical protein